MTRKQKALYKRWRNYLKYSKLSVKTQHSRSKMLALSRRDIDDT